MEEALVDLTGGCLERIQISNSNVRNMLDDGSLWESVQEWLRSYYIVSCERKSSEEDEDDGSKEGAVEDDVSGLLVNHLYTVVATKEIGALKFVKVRNPWGNGAWHGVWGNSSPKWEEHPEVESVLKEDASIDFNRIDPGSFWILWEDFVRNYSDMYVVRLFGENYNQYLIQGQWQGKTAGGRHKMVNQAKALAATASSEKDGQKANKEVFSQEVLRGFPVQIHPSIHMRTHVLTYMHSFTLFFFLYSHTCSSNTIQHNTFPTMNL